MKTFVDYLFSFTGLILLSPVFVIIGLLIIIDDPGPVFFKQKRVGKDGRIFNLYKFRSMKVFGPAADGIFEPGKNSRITRAGKFLRKTKMDELPQLFNVLNGDMSLVGPRPEVEKWVRAFPEEWKKIHSVKPGITDNASIIFRCEEFLLAESPDPEKMYREEILPQKLLLYAQYIEDHSFREDLKIILKTIVFILKPPTYDHTLFKSTTGR